MYTIYYNRICNGTTSNMGAVSIDVCNNVSYTDDNKSKGNSRWNTNGTDDK